MKSFGLICGGVILFGGGLFAGKLLFENEQTASGPGSDQSEVRYRKRSVSSDSRDQRRMEIQAVRDLPGHHERQTGLVSLLWKILPDDPGAVMEMLDEITDRDERESLAKVAAEAWIVADPEAAIAWVSSRSTGSLKSEADSAMFDRIVRIDPLIARQLFELRTRYIQENSISILSSNWAEQDFISAKNFVLAQKDEDLLKSGLVSILGKWGEQNPVEAISNFEEYQHLFEEESRRQALFKIAEGWARVDSNKALEWAKSLDPGPESKGATWRVISTVLKDDPDVAFRMAENSPEQIETPEHLVLPLALTDLPTATQRLKNSSFPDRNEVMGFLIDIYSQTDPLIAAQLYNEFKGFETESGSVVGEISKAAYSNGNSWFGYAPQEAIQWAKSLPAGDLRDQIILDFAGKLQSKDPVEASDLIRLLPEELQKISE